MCMGFFFFASRVSAGLVDQLVSLCNLKAFVMSSVRDMGPHVWAWVDPVRCKCRLEYIEFRSEITDGDVNTWLLRFLTLHSTLDSLVLERTCMSEDSFILPQESQSVRSSLVVLVSRLRFLSLKNMWNFVAPRFVGWLEANFRFLTDPVDERPLCRTVIHFTQLGRGLAPSMMSLLMARGLQVGGEASRLGPIVKEDFCRIYHSFASTDKTSIPRTLVRAMRTILLCHRRQDCLIAMIPKDVIFNCLFSWILRVF